MTDHQCCLSSGTIRVDDTNGQVCAVFIKLCDGRYFGGHRHPEMTFVPGTHMWISLGGMLDIIGRLASAVDDDRFGYSIGSTEWITHIRREMRADEIARVLGCDPKEVIDHFALVVKISDA